MTNTYLKHALAVTGAAALVALAYGSVVVAASYARSVDPTRTRSFSVTATADQVVIPDVAQFTLQVITQGGTDVASLQSINSEKGNAIMEFLKEQGIEEKDIKTSSYDIDPRYQYGVCRYETPCPPPTIVGYTVTQTIGVKVRKFEVVGSVMKGVVERGANSVSQLSFILDDPGAVQEKLRGEAVRKAQLRARSLAQAGSFRVGRLLGVQEGSQPYTPGIRYAQAPDVGGATPAPEPGSEEVSLTVTLIYEIR